VKPLAALATSEKQHCENMSVNTSQKGDKYGFRNEMYDDKPVHTSGILLCLIHIYIYMCIAIKKRFFDAYSKANGSRAVMTMGKLGLTLSPLIDRKVGRNRFPTPDFSGNAMGITSHHTLL
jgi:hypothetical protein